jgi:16S rRNA (adenine1518-N6/adenine1519-N6)-dimethyltransferase
MLQKEVADRMTAGPGSKRYGRLTVMLSAWTDIETCFDIGPGAFNPAPKVRSTLVRIVPRRESKFVIADQAAFERLVGLTFSMRRKTLRRILKGRLAESELTKAGFDPLARPETLTPQEFARLSELTG